MALKVCVLPDTAESVVFPHSADSLDNAVKNFSRSDFELSSAFLSSYEEVENYGDYLDNNYGSSEEKWGSLQGDYYRQKYYDFTAEQEKRLPSESAPKGMEPEEFRKYLEQKSGDEAKLHKKGIIHHPLPLLLIKP